jgi:hypothetical protein
MADLLPEPRGELSEQLLAQLPGGDPVTAWAAPSSEEDFQFSLYLLYELYYRGLPGVDPDTEWRTDLIALRRELETQLEQDLFAVVGPPSDGCDPEEMDLALRAIEEADNSPSLSRFIERRATVEQVLEFMVHRSAYQLKEADPHSFALPRIWGPPKAAMVEIQADEYGGGRPERMHAQLFADAMEAVGLDSTYGAYLDHIPGVALATVNLMSMLGLRRRWRGACVGHLALFEMTSSLPNGRYARGLRRLGLEAATPFFDEHVVADSVHENIAAVDLAGGLARQDPSLAKDILWGARALVHVEGRWSAALVDAFEAGRSSLRAPLGRDALTA